MPAPPPTAREPPRSLAADLRDRAALSAERLGRWEAAQPMLTGMLPPPLFAPDQGPAILSRVLTRALSDFNDDVGGPDSGLISAQSTLSHSAARARGGVPADPAQIVIETGLAEGRTVRLDPLRSVMIAPPRSSIRLRARRWPRRRRERWLRRRLWTGRCRRRPPR